MDQLDAHARAQEVFAAVLHGVGPDDWDRPTPCPEWDVRALVEHVVAGNQRVQLLAGREPVALPDGTAARVRASAAGAHAVFAAEDGMTRTFDLPIGPVPGAAFVGLRTSDVLTHAWDLARATGQSTDLDPELADASLRAARERITPELRGEGRPFGAEQPCDADRPVADRLAAFLGRVV